VATLLVMVAVVVATLVEHAPTVAAEPAVDIAAALALVADTAVAELAADLAAAVTVAADLVAAAMVVAAADTGKFSGFNQKGRLLRQAGLFFLCGGRRAQTATGSGFSTSAGRASLSEVPYGPRWILDRF